MIIHFYFGKYPLRKNWGSSQINFSQRRFQVGGLCYRTSSGSECCWSCWWYLGVCPSTGGVLLLHISPSSPVILLLSPAGRDRGQNKVLGAEIAQEQLMGLVPSIPCWGIIQVRQEMVLEMQVPCGTDGSKGLHKTINDACKKYVFPTPKWGSLKGKWDISRVQLHLSHAKVSVHGHRYLDVRALWGWGWKSGRSPPVCCPWGLLALPCSQPGFQLFPSCSPAAPSSGGSSGNRTPPPLLAWPTLLAWLGPAAAAAAAFGPFLPGWWEICLLSSQPS